MTEHHLVAIAFALSLFAAIVVWAARLLWLEYRATRRR
jgi:hypothetical protein